MITGRVHARCLGQQARQSRPDSSRRVLISARRQCVKAAAAGGGGGLFGGLFGGGGGARGPTADAEAAPSNNTPQQQQQPAQPPSGVGFPPFQTIQRGKEYDLRFYEPHAVVEMDYKRRENAYLTLGQYQDGANAARTAFGFTQPVVMTYYPDGRKTMALMVGAPRDGSTGGARLAAPDLPAPTDASVRVSVAGGEAVAVRRFSGYITPATAEAARQQLLAALAADGLKVADDEAGGKFRVAQYGQVYTLEERLNELLLRIQL